MLMKQKEDNLENSFLNSLRFILIYFLTFSYFKYCKLAEMETTKKYKHKKKKKKKDKDQDKEKPARVVFIQDEEKELNIDVPEMDKKAAQDKLTTLEGNVSDEENRSADTASSIRPQQQRDLDVIRASAARRLAKLPSPGSSSPKNYIDEIEEKAARLYEPSLPALSKSRRGSATSGSYLVASPGSGAGAMSGFRFPPTDPTLMDSDEEPIPLDIYSPRSYNLSGAIRSSLSPGKALSNHGGSDASDSDSDVSYRSNKGRQKRTRRHLMRRHRDGIDVNTRLQQHASYSRSRSFNLSSKLV